MSKEKGELKLCPGCDGSATVSYPERGYWRRRCLDCGWSGPIGKTDAEADEFWNTRAEPEPAKCKCSSTDDGKQEVHPDCRATVEHRDLPYKSPITLQPAPGPDYEGFAEKVDKRARVENEGDVSVQWLTNMLLNYGIWEMRDGVACRTDWGNRK